MTQVAIDHEVETDIEIPNPGKYKVVIRNDDSTPMDFVIALLMSIFKHSQESATDITMKIHNDGAGIAGIYSYEIAEQKGIESTLLARQHGWPLQINVEPQ
jgi:ATP-dependent Clp protease adaptor protein ClpS